MRTIIDQRDLDNNLIEYYSDISCTNTWLSADNRIWVGMDKKTAYEIDDFDKYSQDTVSNEHLLDMASDILRNYMNIGDKEWVFMSMNAHKEVLGSVLRLLEEIK